MIDADDLIAPAVNGAHGVVAILGDNVQALAQITQREEVTRVFLITLCERTLSAARPYLTPAQYEKIEHVELNPFRARHGDIDHESLDFMFADLWDDPWDLRRIDALQMLQRTFRPRRLTYRWQELDIAALWLSEGRALEGLNHVEAIDMFRLGTMIMVEPRTDDYVSRCQSLAREMLDAAPAARKKA